MSNAHKFPHSSGIQEIDYDEAKKELYVTFATGGKHCFSACNKEVYDGFKEAKSAGGYFHTNVRRKYESRNMDKEKD